MEPTKTWMKQWEQVRDSLTCPVDLNAYFEQSEIAGTQLAIMDIGPCSFPTGQILVRDPLCYLYDLDEQPYFLTVSPGTYRTEVCVVTPGDEGDCARYAAVRLRFTDLPAVRFEEALVGDEDFSELEDEDYFGFAVDAGMGCVCDEGLHRKFYGFAADWYEENPDGNLYDDYFAPLLAENANRFPRYQRSEGDWLNWTIPGTEYHLPIFQAGFGDGVYPVYWGYAQDGSICQLVVQFIDIQLAYGNPSDTLDLEDFENAEGCCEGEVDLDEWDALFECEGPYVLSFDIDADKTLQAFSPVQKAGYDYLSKNPCDLVFPVLNELLKEWPSIQEQYSYEGQSPEERQEMIPDVTDINGLLPLLAPSDVVVYDLALEGQPYIGIQFSCSWDDEHGFGAMLCGDRVVKIGGTDTALLRWIAQRDLEAHASH